MHAFTTVPSDDDPLAHPPPLDACADTVTTASIPQQDSAAKYAKIVRRPSARLAFLNMVHTSCKDEVGELSIGLGLEVTRIDRRVIRISGEDRPRWAKDRA